MALRVAPSVASTRSAVRRPRSVACQASSNVNLGAAISAAACAGILISSSPALAQVSLNIKDKATVSSPVHVEFAVKGLTVKPASEGLQPGTGHFHLLVDEATSPEEGEVIPFDKTHLHYGKGQTAADIELTPGKHTLTLQFANAVHESYGPKEASTITVTVK